MADANPCCSGLMDWVSNKLLIGKQGWRYYGEDMINLAF